MRSIGPADVNFFRSQLGVDCIPADRTKFPDWTGTWGRLTSPGDDDHETTTFVVFPTSTAEVSAIVRYCTSQDIAITPQGGNTGLVGGSVPLANELILSLDKMDEVQSFDDLSGVLVCQAGATLSCLNSALEQYGYTMPLDLGPRDRVQIGGAVATNAGGLRFARYGSLHGNVLGLEVVLADRDGTVLDLGLSTAMQKDNTGYALKNLFIGAEGTLGIVTKAAIKCAIDYKSVHLAVVTCKTFEDVMVALRMARIELGEILSAFEYMDHESLKLAGSIVGWDEVRALFEDVAGPGNMSEQHQYCIIECRGSCEAHDRAKMDGFLESLNVTGRIVDTRDHDRIWKARTSVSAGLRAHGAVFKYDVSLPTRQMHEMVVATKQRLEEGNAPPATVCGFGHIMDGNLHLNVAVAKMDMSEGGKDVAGLVNSILEPWVYEEVTRRRGSISAEHGIGTLKASALAATKNSQVLGTMRAIKDLFDPSNTLNPDKLFT